MYVPGAPFTGMVMDSSAPVVFQVVMKESASAYASDDTDDVITTKNSNSDTMQRPVFGQISFWQHQGWYVVHLGRIWEYTGYDGAKLHAILANAS